MLWAPNCRVHGPQIQPTMTSWWPQKNMENSLLFPVILKPLKHLKLGKTGFSSPNTVHARFWCEVWNAPFLIAAKQLRHHFRTGVPRSKMFHFSLCARDHSWFFTYDPWYYCFFGWDLSVFGVLWDTQSKYKWIYQDLLKKKQTCQKQQAAQRLLHCICYFCFTSFGILARDHDSILVGNTTKKQTSRSQTADGPLVDHEGPLTRERRCRDLNDQNDLHTISIHTIRILLKELGNIPITHPSFI